MSNALAVRYNFSSHLGPQGLSLASSIDTVAAVSTLFDADVLKPVEFAQILLLIGKNASTRYHVPPGMLVRILREADPVFTSGKEWLRAESFSLCCGVYARADFHASAFAIRSQNYGTTNIDCSPELRAELAKIRGQSVLKLKIGREAVEVQHGDQALIEKKIDLPRRWLKGFVEVQSYLSRMTLWKELSMAEALKFSRVIPGTSSADTELWLVPNGAGLRLSGVATEGALKIGGIERLKALESLFAKIKKLSIFADLSSGTSAWVLDFGTSRLTLALSAERYRGFSGEGQALAALASDQLGPINKIRANLHWQQELRRADIGAFAPESKQIESALMALGSQGLLGFDLVEQAYYHRVLPFALEDLEQLHPRLKAARQLRESDAIQIEPKNGDTIRASCKTKNGHYLLEYGDDSIRCSCPWFSENQGQRGLCKHLLALEMILESKM